MAVVKLVVVLVLMTRAYIEASDDGKYGGTPV